VPTRCTVGRFWFIGSRLCSTLLSDLPPGDALRFAITSPPSGCEQDLHRQAVAHARHAKKWARITRAQARRQLYAEGESQSQTSRSLKPDLLLPAVTSGLHRLPRNICR
jgi:hypothetical protein